MTKLQKLADQIPVLLNKTWPRDVTHVEVNLVTSAVSARVHREFFQDPTPTDVMSFMHGELIICPAVAAKQRHLENLSLSDELLTYIIHGLLHLCGWDDQTDQDFSAMQVEQTRIRQMLLSSKPKR